MDYVTNKKVAEEKLKRLQQGYCAYCDSKEVASILKKGIESLHLHVHEEVTDRGYWYTPEASGTMNEQDDSGDVVILN